MQLVHLMSLLTVRHIQCIMKLFTGLLRDRKLTNGLSVQLYNES